MNKIINYIDSIWNSKEIIQNGRIIDGLVDVQLQGKELSLGNLLNITNHVLSMVIQNNKHTMKKGDYYMFAAIGIRTMSQYGAPSNSNISISKFGNSFKSLNWEFPSQYSKETVLTLFLNSMQEDFNISLL